MSRLYCHKDEVMREREKMRIIDMVIDFSVIQIWKEKGVILKQTHLLLLVWVVVLV